MKMERSLIVEDKWQIFEERAKMTRWNEWLNKMQSKKSQTFLKVIATNFILKYFQKKIFFFLHSFKWFWNFIIQQKNYINLGWILKCRWLIWITFAFFGWIIHLFFFFSFHKVSCSKKKKKKYRKFFLFSFLFFCCCCCCLMPMLREEVR